MQSQQSKKIGNRLTIGYGLHPKGEEPKTIKVKAPKKEA